MFVGFTGRGPMLLGPRYWAHATILANRRAPYSRLLKIDSVRLLDSPNEKRVPAEMTKTHFLFSADERT